ncbi:MAG: arylesterase [Bdellovibrionales bacterium]|nr:arylesterase [Bdellovibrionales bacterium]
MAAVLAVFGCTQQNQQETNHHDQVRSSSNPSITIAFLGDSLTEGFGIQNELSYPSRIEALFQEQKKQSIRVINAGISGSTTASAASRMKWLVKSKPDWVVLALGGNDALRGLLPTEIKKNLKEAIDIAKSNHINVLLAGMKAPPNMGKDYTERFENVFSELAKAYPDMTFMPFLLEGVGGEANLNLPDGIHPNEKGHEVIAQHLFGILKKQL